MVKTFIAALLGTILVVGGGRVFLKTNDIRNYPSLAGAAASARGTQTPTLVGAPAGAPTGEVQRKNSMSAGEEAAAEAGFSTELEAPQQ